jgi:hypothetical protein
MRLREGVADLAARFAYRFGRSMHGDGPSRLGIWPYRVASAVVRRLGGRLESRIVSMGARTTAEDRQIGLALQRIEAALREAGIPWRIVERSLSRDAAAAVEGASDFLTETATALVLYEVFVPTPPYWTASLLVERVLAPPDGGRTESDVPAADARPAAKEEPAR